MKEEPRKLRVGYDRRRGLYIIEVPGTDLRALGDTPKEALKSIKAQIRDYYTQSARA